MLDPNYTHQFAEYEAPVYVTFNHKNNITTLGPASGHPSTSSTSAKKSETTSRAHSPPNTKPTKPTPTNFSHG